MVFLAVVTTCVQDIAILFPLGSSPNVKRIERCAVNAEEESAMLLMQCRGMYISDFAAWWDYLEEKQVNLLFNQGKCSNRNFTFTSCGPSNLLPVP